MTVAIFLARQVEMQLFWYLHRYIFCLCFFFGGERGLVMFSQDANDFLWLVVDTGL